MSHVQKIVLERLPQKPASPALRQIIEMAKDEGVEAMRQRPMQPVDEVLSLWSIRLWNVTVRARRLVGLADLVRALMRLSPDEKVEQFAFTIGLKTGLVFFVAKTHEPIGAVISVRTESDQRRSYRNWEQANGIPVPTFLTGSGAR